MPANLFDRVSEIFYDASEKTINDVNILLSEKVNFPRISINSKMEIVMSLPKLENNKYYFCGMIFTTSENDKRNIMSLFLSSIYHLAAHAAVSNYSIYEEWFKDKTKEVCWNVIDFIEDTAAERYLFLKNNEIFQNVQSISSMLLENMDRNEVKKSTLNSKDIFSKYYINVNHEKIEKIKDQIIKKRDEPDSPKHMIEIADFLYKNRILLPKHVLPFCEHHDDELIDFKKNEINFEFQGSFDQQIKTLTEVWEHEEKQKTRLLARYKKHMEGLNFDDVVLPEIDMPMFIKIKTENASTIRKVKDQIRSASNAISDSREAEVGVLDMQAAIQAVASQKMSNVFEQDSVTRQEESWAILIDNSASMKLRHDKIRQFIMTLCESADELTGREGAWSMYGFGSKFTVIKDSNEKFSNDVKGRIGGMESGGLSFLPDAIELAGRILDEDVADRKYIFVISDGQPSGYDGIEERTKNCIKKLERSGIKIIGIGLTDGALKFFKIGSGGSEMKEMVSKFISAYRVASSQYL